MASWAGLSATSLYKGLRKLRAAQLIVAKPDTKKSGKGPAGFLYAASAKGRSELRRRIVHSLAYVPGHSAPFRVALACSEQVPAKRAAEQLDRRATQLRLALANIQRAQSTAREPVGAKLVFAYTLAEVRHELEQAIRLKALLVKR